MKKEKFTPNLFPFIAIAFAKNSKVHTLIDELYNADKKKYSELAKKDFWYNSLLIKGYDLITEEYAKKMIGLLEDISDDDMKALIKKGWPKFYSWATSVESLIIEECLNKFFYKSQDNPEHTIFSVAVIFTAGKVLSKTIVSVEQETRQDLQEVVDGLIDVNSKNFFLNHKNMLEHAIYISTKIFHNLCDRKQINNNFKSIWTSNDKIVKSASFIIESLFILEDLSLDIVESTDLNDNEFAEMIAIYLNFNINDNSVDFLDNKLKTIFSFDIPIDGDLFDCVCSSLAKDNESIFISIAYMVCIRKMLKAYKKAKEFYTKKTFENNKLVDSQRRKIVELEAENERLRSKLKKLETDNKEIERKLNSKFNKTLYQYKAENKKLEETAEALNSKIDSYKKEIQLLLNLNAAMANELAVETEEIDYDFVNDLNVKGIRGVIVGGHPKWQNMMKGYLPNFKFIGIDDINFDTALLENADAVFINTKYASHSLLYKVISAVKNKNIDIHYINCNNKNYVLNRISDIAC